MDDVIVADACFDGNEVDGAFTLLVVVPLPSADDVKFVVDDDVAAAADANVLSIVDVVIVVVTDVVVVVVVDCSSAPLLLTELNVAFAVVLFILVIFGYFSFQWIFCVL